MRPYSNHIPYSIYSDWYVIVHILIGTYPDLYGGLEQELDKAKCIMCKL